MSGPPGPRLPESVFPRQRRFVTDVGRMIKPSLPDLTGNTLVMALFALLVTGLMASILAFDYLPTNDGPQHVFVGHVTNEIASGNGFYVELFQPGEAWSPLGFDFLYGVLSSFFSWKTALRLTVMVVVLVWASGAVALAGVVRPERRIIGMFGIALSLQWALYMGFFSYVLSCGLAWWGIFLLLRAKLDHWSTRLGFGVLCLATCISHTFGGLLLAATAILSEAALRNGFRAKIKSVGWTALMVLPAIAVWHHSTGSLQFLEKLADFRTSTNQWLPAGDALVLGMRGFVTGGDWKRLVVGVVIAVGWMFSLTRLKAQRITGAEVVLLLLSVGAGAAYFASPVHLRAWELVSPRFLPVVLVAAIPLVPFERLAKPTLRTSVMFACAILSAAMLTESASFHARLVQGCAPGLAGLDAEVQAEGMRLPVFGDTSCGLPTRWQDSPVPFMQPLMNAGALYAVEQGGVVPNTFTVIPQIHVLTKTNLYWDRMPEAPDRREYLPVLIQRPLGDPVRVATVMSLVKAGREFQDLIIFKAPDLRYALEQAGFEVLWERGDVVSLGFPQGHAHSGSDASKPP